MDVREKPNPSYWWTPLLFGVIFIIAGIWILRSPMESYEQITRFIGVIIVVSGTSQILVALRHRKEYPRWGFQAIGGPIDLLIGCILILNPSLLLRIITLFVGIWLFVISISMIKGVIESRKTRDTHWKWNLIIAVFLLVLAILFFWHPMFIGITFAIWTGLAFIFLGVCRIALPLWLGR